MLGRQGPPDPDVIRNLGVIVVAVELGAVVHPTEPNYALLSGATKTIQKVVVALQNGDRQIAPILHRESPRSLSELGHGPMHNVLEPWDFEFSFWANLAEHPGL